MAFNKKVLFVRPETDLFYANQEANEVVNLLGAKLLSGTVTHESLMTSVRQNQPQILIISSHGNDEGILLSDGIIGPELLKPILGMSNIELVYLNTCSSRLTAMKIYNELPVNFICTISKTPDRTAFITMTAFAHHLRNGLDYPQAWFRSRAAGNVNFFFVPKIDMSTEAMTMENFNKDRPPKINGNGELENIHEEVVRLSYLMYGNPKWNLQGLIPSIAQMQKDISLIRTLVYILTALILMTFVGVLVWLLV
jgi:hypothetical protein